MCRIVIVDDDVDFLTVVKSLLHKKGFEVSAFHEWSAAWETIKVYEPELVLLDVFLPDTDGLDACKKIKSSYFTRHIPVIVFSSFPNIGDTAIYEFGADDFIAKPFKVNEVVDRIQHLLDKKSLV